MDLEFKFENPSHGWSVLHVFKKFFEHFRLSNPSFKIDYINSSNLQDRFQGGPNSPHVMTITNKQNKKYILVSYWDKVEDFFLVENGWDVKNCIEIISSVGTDSDLNITPFSYLPYSIIFDELSKSAKKMEDKTKIDLFFRGFLYGDRLELKKINKINISNEKIFPDEKYFKDLTENKICLSLNGAGEICNRDMEILSARSVLFRPKLKIKFHNDLIENFHYIPFELNKNPKIQSEIILEKYNEIKENFDLLKFISENGYEWFLKNGTINSNVNILQNLINIKKLI